MKSFITKTCGTKTAAITFPLLFFVGISLFYCFATPLWVPPDEDRHYVYCEYIARHNKLPYLEPQKAGPKVAQAIHPPLYYILASLFCHNTLETLQDNLVIDESPGYSLLKLSTGTNPEETLKIIQSAYLLRLFSIFLSAITVCCTCLLVLIIFPGQYYAAVAAALFVAANPQFIHISASVSNEPMSMAFSACYLLAIIAFSKKDFGFRKQVVAGMLLGCCLLIKTSTLIYIPVTFFSLVLLSPKNTVDVFKKFVFIMLIAVGVSGWWYCRNLIVYADPVFSKALNIMQPWSLRGTPMSLDYLLLVAKMTFISFFGFFGAMQVPLSVWHLVFYGALIVASGAGFIVYRFGKNLSSEQARIIITMVCAVLFGIFLYASFNVTYTMFMGRYLFGVIVPVSVCFSTGLWLLFPHRWRTLLLLLTSLLLVIVCWDVYWRIVNPVFAKSGLHTGIEQKEFCCVTPSISNTFSIQQTFVSPADNLCAIRVMFARNNKPKAGTIRFVLKHAGDEPESIVTIDTPVDQIDDFSKILFVFPPVANAKGKQFTFIFDTQEISRNEYPALIYDTAVAIEEGPMYFGNQREKGALFFATFHSPGDNPKNNWQGKRALVICEGWYVSIRELQLYGEFSRQTILWRQTNEKIQRVESFLRHRSQQE